MRRSSLKPGLLLVLVLLAACAAPGQTNWLPSSPLENGVVPVYSYVIVNTFPHDSAAYTEGLLYDHGFLYESTGRYGESSLRRVELETGKVLQRINLPASFFGEGISLLSERIFQLTWKEHTGFIYDRASLNLLAEFSYPWEGWGLTSDGDSLILSDGTPTLHFLDPDTFAETRLIEVTDGGLPVKNLNELEYAEGNILANVWQTDTIVAIDPETGRVKSRIDLSGLLPAEKPRETILNGIAYDSGDNRLFLTAKLWDKLYEIRLVGIKN